MYTLFTPGIFSPLCTHRSRSASHPQNRTPSPAAAVKKHFVWLMINVVVNQNKHNVDFQLSIFVVHSPMARWPFLPFFTASRKCWLLVQPKHTSWSPLLYLHLSKFSRVRGERADGHFWWRSKSSEKRPLPLVIQATLLLQTTLTSHCYCYKPLPLPLLQATTTSQAYKPHNNSRLTRPTNDNLMSPSAPLRKNLLAGLTGFCCWKLGFLLKYGLISA